MMSVRFCISTAFNNQKKCTRSKRSIFLNAISAFGLKSVVKRRGSARVSETAAATGRKGPVKAGAHCLAALVAGVAGEALVDERGGANCIRVVLVAVQVLQRELVIPRGEPSSDRTLNIYLLSRLVFILKESKNL